MTQRTMPYFYGDGSNGFGSGYPTHLGDGAYGKWQKRHLFPQLARDGASGPHLAAPIQPHPALFYAQGGIGYTGGRGAYPGVMGMGYPGMGYPGLAPVHPCMGMGGPGIGYLGAAPVHPPVGGMGGHGMMGMGRRQWPGYGRGGFGMPGGRGGFGRGGFGGAQHGPFGADPGGLGAAHGAFRGGHGQFGGAGHFGAGGWVGAGHHQDLGGGFGPQHGFGGGQHQGDNEPARQAANGDDEQQFG